MTKTHNFPKKNAIRFAYRDPDTDTLFRRSLRYEAMSQQEANKWLDVAIKDNGIRFVNLRTKKMIFVPLSNILEIEIDIIE